MFTKSARFYDSLYAFKDYAAASERLRALIEHRVPGARSLLDVGCGTGRHLESLARHFEVAGVDIDPGLLAIARQRLPNVPLHEADMSHFDLGRRFDVVTCLFSAIGYVRTIEKMRKAVAAMARHVEPGGLIVIEPWFTPDSYWTGTITANLVDEPDLKIAWMYTSQREDDLSVLDIHYLVGRPTGVRTLHERQELGLFTERQQLDALRDAALEARHESDTPLGRGLYVAWDSTS